MANEIENVEELVAAARIAATPEQPVQEFWREVEERLDLYDEKRTVEPRQVRE